MTPEWRFRSEYIKNCNCAMGCPCDFWATPTHGSCQGMFANRILEGHYGSVRLDGLIFAGAYHWPGALHLGNGTFQPYVLDKASLQNLKKENPVLTSYLQRRPVIRLPPTEA